MNVFFALKESKDYLFLFCMEMQRRRYDELSLKTCTILPGEKSRERNDARARVDQSGFRL